jgi:hypothetical protein
MAAFFSFTAFRPAACFSRYLSRIDATIFEKPHVT